MGAADRKSDDGPTDGPRTMIIDSHTVDRSILEMGPGLDTAVETAHGGCAAVGSGKLTWSPTAAGVGDYPSYKKVSIVPGTRSYSGDGGDLWLELPATQRWEAPATGGLVISKARNVVLIGGEVYLPATIPAEETPRRSIYLVDITGTVFIEGLWIHGPGCGDIFTINAPQAKFYLQQIRAEITMKSEQSLPVHADLIQPWGGHAGLFIDRFTGLTSYQGFQIEQSLAPVGAVWLRRVNLRHHPDGASTANYQIWLDSEMQPIHIDGDTVWVEPAPDRPSPALVHSLWPQGWILQNDALGSFATHPTLKNGGGLLVVQDWAGAGTGRFREGRPSGCDYVESGAAGLGYLSPGYL